MTINKLNSYFLLISLSHNYSAVTFPCLLFLSYSSFFRCFFTHSTFTRANTLIIIAHAINHKTLFTWFCMALPFSNVWYFSLCCDERKQKSNNEIDHTKFFPYDLHNIGKLRDRIYAMLSLLLMNSITHILWQFYYLSLKLIIVETDRI